MRVQDLQSHRKGGQKCQNLVLKSHQALQIAKYQNNRSGYQPMRSRHSKTNNISPTRKRRSVKNLFSVAKYIAPVNGPDPLPSLTIVPCGEQPGLVCSVHRPYLHAHVVSL
jgi:hypothetical protein